MIDFSSKQLRKILPMQKLHHELIKKICLSLLILITQACSTTTNQIIQDSQNAVEIRSQNIQSGIRRSSKPPMLIIQENNPRFTTRSIELSRNNMLPANIQSVTVRMPGRHSLISVADIISRTVGVPVIMQPDALASPLQFSTLKEAENKKIQQNGSSTPFADSQVNAKEGPSRIELTAEQANTSFELNYSGPLQGLLDQIASQAQLIWSYEDERVVFRRIITRTLAIKTLPGSAKGSASLSMVGGTNFNTDMDADLWTTLDKTIALMISSQGQVQIDKSNGLITVRDTVSNVREIERYIYHFNTQLLRQVSIHVEVLQIDMSADSQNGIDWGNLSRQIPGVGKLTAQGAPYAGLGDAFNIGIIGSDNTSVLFKALETYGRVSTTYSSILTTLHRQPVPLSVNNMTTYLRSVAAGTTSASGIMSGPSLLVSEINTGLSISILPIVLDTNRILIQSSLNVSALREMKSYTTGSGSTLTSVQQPSVDNFSSIQRTYVKAGQTIVLLGYQFEDSKSKNNDIIKKILPSSNSTASNKKSVVILMTPRVLDM